MSNGVSNEVRDRISAFLGGRGTFNMVDKLGAPHLGWASADSAVVWVAFNGDSVRVERAPGETSRMLEVPADAPDLLKRLGETLTELRV